MQSVQHVAACCRRVLTDADFVNKCVWLCLKGHRGFFLNGSEHAHRSPWVRLVSEKKKKVHLAHESLQLVQSG